MSYYKKLEQSELDQLQEDFIKFLVLNGITGDDWEKLKSNSPEKAESMIEQFSEVVFESSLRKASFLLMVDDHAVRAFQCGAEQITMAALHFNGTQEFSFHKVNDLRTLLSDGQYNLSVASVQKQYNKKREHEMYDMINSGCKISDGKVFKLLSMHWAELKSSQN